MNGKRIFLNMAAESSLMYSRVLLNFLGIYKKQRERKLESRAPHKNFQHSEVWIERFPNGELLDISTLCKIPATGLHPNRLRAYIIETLHAASRGVAHLTVPERGSIAASKLKILPLMWTCYAVRHHIKEHFYKKTLRLPPPAGMEHFDDFIESTFALPNR